MNAQFYPKLLEYQGGSTMAEKVKAENIPVDEIYKINERHTWALDFYNQNPVNIVSASELKKMKAVWVYATDKELEQLKKKELLGIIKLLWTNSGLPDYKSNSWTPTHEKKIEQNAFGAFELTYRIQFWLLKW